MKTIEIIKKIKSLKNELELEYQNKSGIMGKNLKKLRLENDMTQTELSDLTGLSRTQVTNIELGNSQTSIKTLIKLCDIFESTPNDLLGY